MRALCAKTAARAAICALVCALGLSGCVIRPPVQSQSGQPILPYEEITLQRSTSVRLYFRFGEEAVLSGDTRDLVLPESQSEEQYLIQQLIAGPSLEKTHLRGLFNPGVTVRVDADTVPVVVLSENFLDKPQDVPMGWQSSEVLRDEVCLRRRLAVYAIVNTITERGRYDAVQILVQDASGLRRQLRQSELGLQTGDADAFAGPFTRVTGVLLTPEKAASLVLENWKIQRWDTLYAYMAGADAQGERAPSLERITQSLFAGAPVLIEYDVWGVTVSADGLRATVSVTVRLHAGLGVQTRENIAVELLCENESWRVSAASLEKLMREVDAT